MTDIEWIEPRKAQLLVRISKRKATGGGILLHDNAHGYDDIRIIKRGPDAAPDFVEGRHIVLAPGTYMVEIVEAPGYAYVDSDQVIGFDNRTDAERCASDTRLVMAGGA